MRHLLHPRLHTLRCGARARSFTAAAALGAVLSACGGGSSGGGPDNGSIRGNLVVLAENSSTLEAEPNDTIAQAHVLGDLMPGGTRNVLGSITDDGSDDFDGFRITATERVTIDLQLLAESMSADLDVFIFEPVSMQVVKRFETNNASEMGSFVLDGTFFVVVSAFVGSSTYELRLTATAAPAVLAEVEPNDIGGQAMYLGVLEDAEALAIDGELIAMDVADRFLVALPAAGPFSFNLTHGLGIDFDVTLSDATADVLNPTVIQQFTSGTSPEAGSINVGAMTLVEVKVEPFGGATGPWQMTMQGGSAPRLAPTGLAVAPLSSAPRGNSRDSRHLFDGRGKTRQATARPTLTHFGAVEAPLWPGVILVQPTSDLDLDMRLASRGGATRAQVPNGPRKVEFELPTNLDAAQQARYSVALAATLSGCTGADFAEPDYRVRPLFDTRPNDTHYNLQWHYEQVRLPAAWDVTTGSNSVTIAVLDTGSTPHPDLVGREVQGIDMISNPTIAGDGDGIDNDPFDVGDSTGLQPSSFHGSHVAGTIGASTNNGVGVSGVTWQGRIMHVRVLGIGGGSTFDILNGILYSASLANASNQLPAQRADILNMSLGGSGFSQMTQNAVTAARNAGCLIVAAAGNENSSQPSYPAAYSGVLSVSAVDFEANRAPYSNFHATVALAAPGGDVSVDRNGDGFADGVLSAKPDDSVSPINYSAYAFYQGTSMAAPHVAGVAALVLAVDPNLTPAQLESILTTTATDLGAPGRDTRFGFGLVNAFAAVSAAGGGGGGAPVLSLSSDNILFSTRADDRRIGIANVGGGLLEVTNVVATTISGGNWLSATRVVVTGSASTDTSGIDLTVDAMGLADGFYSGAIEVQSTGGSRTLEVTLALSASTGSTVYTVFVIAVNAETFATVAQDEIQTSALTNGYSLSVPAGTYYLVAGTDEDNDDEICDPGEPLCGLYPSLGLPQAITITEGATLNSRDFPLQSAQLPNIPGSGFRRLPSRAELQNRGEVR